MATFTFSTQGRKKELGERKTYTRRSRMDMCIWRGGGGSNQKNTFADGDSKPRAAVQPAADV